MQTLRHRAPALLLTLAACSAPEDSHVAYKSGAPLGDWYDVPIHQVEDGVSTEPPAAGDADMSTAQGGQSAPAADGGRRDDDAGTSESGSGGVPMLPTSMPMGATSVSFEVTPKAQHLRAKPFKMGDDENAWGPSNIGAIWVVNEDDRKLVKSMSVWAAERLQNLIHYKATIRTARADAITSATLPDYVKHEADWKMVDVKGMTVPPGRYRLCVEVADYDTAEVKNNRDLNAYLEVPFDTTMYPQTITPEDTEFLVDMKLTIQ